MYGTCMYVHGTREMRRKKERSKQGQTNKTRQNNTAHPRQSRTHDTLYSRQSALPTELPRQLSWHVRVHMYVRHVCTCMCVWYTRCTYMVHVQTWTCTRVVYMRICASYMTRYFFTNSTYMYVGQEGEDSC